MLQPLSQQLCCPKRAGNPSPVRFVATWVDLAGFTRLLHASKGILSLGWEPSSLFRPSTSRTTFCWVSRLMRGQTLDMATHLVEQGGRCRLPPVLRSGLPQAQTICLGLRSFPS